MAPAVWLGCVAVLCGHCDAACVSDFDLLTQGRPEVVFCRVTAFNDSKQTEQLAGRQGLHDLQDTSQTAKSPVLVREHLDTGTDKLVPCG